MRVILKPTGDEDVSLTVFPNFDPDKHVIIVDWEKRRFHLQEEELEHN